MNTKKSISLAAPEGASAALYFLEGSYCFQSVGDGSVVQKFVSPASVRDAFAKEPLDSGWLPPGVNRYGVSAKGAWMVRWHAPAIYDVHLEGIKQPLRVPMPSLIWIGQKHNYFILAAREKTFTQNAMLYRAPLANVNRSGLICFGANAHPDVAAGGFDRAWRTFWEASFNNDHDDGKSEKYPDAINDHLRELARAKAKTYPLVDLVSTHTTLNAAIERLTKRGNEWS